MTLWLMATTGGAAVLKLAPPQAVLDARPEARGHRAQRTFCVAYALTVALGAELTISAVLRQLDVAMGATSTATAAATATLVAVLLVMGGKVIIMPPCLFYMDNRE